MFQKDVGKVYLYMYLYINIVMLKSTRSLIFRNLYLGKEENYDSLQGIDVNRDRTMSYYQELL